MYDETSYIYLIELPHNDETIVKIGRTHYPKERIKAYKKASKKSEFDRIYKIPQRRVAIDLERTAALNFPKAKGREFVRATIAEVDEFITKTLPELTKEINQKEKQESEIYRKRAASERYYQSLRQKELREFLAEQMDLLPSAEARDAFLLGAKAAISWSRKRGYFRRGITMSVRKWK